MSVNFANIIFGMKVHQARSEARLTLAELAERCELSPSYMTEVEKGRKYPRTDKIMRMAEVLGKDYDEIVSIKLAPSMAYLQSAISSPFLSRFPFEEFGFEAGDLVNLLTRQPDKTSALVHALLEITRRYDLKEEDFLKAALRSYQEIYENYFQELEDTAASFREELATNYKLETDVPIDPTILAKILQKKYGYEIDRTSIAADPLLKDYRSIFIKGTGAKKSGIKLFLNSLLQPRQIKFLLAQEIGYQYLKLTERSSTSSPNRIDSFEQILNDFKTAYFGGALLMPQSSIIEDLQNFFRQPAWEPQLLLGMLHKYDVTPEMLLYRFSELIPQFFGIKLHFLRFHNNDGEYILTKQLNMNHLLVPSGIGLQEHYCRRWLSSCLLSDLKKNASTNKNNIPVIGVQLSEFLESKDRFLCFGFSRPLVLTPKIDSSIIIGFRVDSDLRSIIRFFGDPAIPNTIINETCERCPLTAKQCQVRAAKPTILQAEQEEVSRKLAINQLGQPDKQ